jgi:hypothetical protein
MLYYTYVCYIHTYCTHVSIVPVHTCCIHTTYILHLIWVDINEFCKDQWLWVDKGCKDSPVVGDGAGSFLALFYMFYSDTARRQRHLIHHLDDRLCIWTPSKADIELVRQRGFKITCIKGWRGYLGGAQAPLRLVSWCSFELDGNSRTLLHDLAMMCETPDTPGYSLYRMPSITWPV